MAIPGVFRPRLDASFKDQAYRQDDTKTPGLSVSFLGTRTLVLSDGRNVIMTDGFFTRPSWTTLALGTLESSAQEVEFALGRINARKVDTILVAHAHHDHAMDSGIVAQRTGAAVYGSESTLNIARGQNTPEAQLHRLALGQTLSFGDFKVTAYETPHSPEPINIGSVDHPLHTPAKLSAYKLDQNFSFLVEHRLGNVLIVPSAQTTSPASSRASMRLSSSWGSACWVSSQQNLPSAIGVRSFERLELGWCCRFIGTISRDHCATHLSRCRASWTT